MSEEKQPSAKPPLTTQEQVEKQQEDEALIDVKFVVTDVSQQLSNAMGVLGLGTGGRTSFDGYRLNQMLDLLESASPSHLEHAAESLKAAKTALNEAAKELDAFVKATHWEGEGAAAFKAYGSDVVAYAWGIGKIANAVGAQMEVASTGLTSVRNAQPPRDTRAVQKKLEDFPLAERSNDNPEYQRYLQVERDRQEAINQMNRLASFYAISQETLAVQPMPDPPRAYMAAVPPPTTGTRRVESGDSSSGDEVSNSTRQQSDVRQVEITGTDGRPRTDTIGLVAPTPSRDPSMEIDTVAAPPAPTTLPGQAPAQTVPGTAPPVVSMPPVTGGFPPVRGGTPRVTGTSGVPRPRAEGVNPPGRAATAGRGPAEGRAGAARSGPAPMGGTGGTGRVGPVGQSPVAGRPAGTGRVGPAGQSPVAGRPAGTVGQPTAGRTGTGPSNGAARGGRADGIVGGNPQRATTTGSSGSRIPRGTVIGGEGTTPGRSAAGRVGQQGVIGANPANNSSRPGGRVTAGPNGVVGTPRADSSRSRPGAGGFTQGGSGLVRGSKGRNESENEEQEPTGSTRPDYLTEDEETWTARRRGAVPPVID